MKEDSNEIVSVPVKRKPPAAGKGKAKGTLNKLTRTVKDTIDNCAHGLGGSNRLLAWCKESALNERLFWTTIYPKLLPLQVTGSGGGPITIEIVRFAETRNEIDITPSEETPCTSQG
jgi:hypothetical protein